MGSSERMMESFPELVQLLAGWFHQDYDLEGDSVEEVMRAWIAVATRPRREELLWEVDRYLEQAGSDVADRFVADFSPDIDAEAFPGGTAGFLREILRTLE